MRVGPTAASGREWAVATPHQAATEAGADVFAEGGNAVDAAVTAAVTLAVAYPHMCGVGGDLFALVRIPNGQTIAINSSGAAPLDINPDAVRASHKSMPQSGPLAITVPGAPGGWATLLAEGGTIDRARAFAPAIAFAHEGLPVARSLRDSLIRGVERNLADPGLRSVFYRGGDVPEAGTPLVQPALAGTLEAIAADGPDALYRGDVGQRYVEGLRRAGSPMRTDDLEHHRVDVVPPLIGRYRKLDVNVVPPNSQGFVLLEILAAIERMGLDPDPLGADAGIMARLFSTVAADRDRHNADPRVERVNVASLLDDGHIAALADEAREGFESSGGFPAPGAPSPAAGALPSRPSGDTIALVTADAEGRAVSLIQSLYNGFGSGILEPATGIVAQNRGACFTLDPSSRNTLAGGKRPAHSLMPVVVHREGRPAAVLGTMGGFAQPQINAFNVLRLFDLGRSPDEALRKPRWLVGGMDPASGHRFVEAESGVPDAARRSLRAAGFEIEELEEADGAGHAHCIKIRSDGSLESASDPRSDGGAAAR
jgi:gamma-glutamyltranspeptidase